MHDTVSDRDQIRRWLGRFSSDDKGGTAIEYGLILTFIALAIITAATQIGTKTAGVFTKISDLWPF